MLHKTELAPFSAAARSFRGHTGGQRASWPLQAQADTPCPLVRKEPPHISAEIVWDAPIDHELRQGLEGLEHCLAWRVLACAEAAAAPV